MAEGTGRVEAFRDGVFAIAITLLILGIRVPHAGVEGGLWAGLVALWPSYLAFVLSFFVILVMWVNHHQLMRLVRAVGYPFLFANGLVLLTVTFVPFPTAVLAEYLATTEARAAVTFYCGTFVVISLAWCLLFVAIARGQLFRPDVDVTTIGRIRRAYMAGAPVHVGFDGSVAPVLMNGTPSGETMAITRVDALHTSTVLKMNGTFFGTSKSTLSADGRTLTVLNDFSSSAGGQAVGKYTEVWVRQ